MALLRPAWGLSVGTSSTPRALEFPRLTPLGGGIVSTSLLTDPCWRTEGLVAMDEHNEDLLEVLDELRQQPFFRYYDMDMLNGCNFFPQTIDECDRTCELYPVDDGSVPASIVATDSEEYDFELDGWVRWDMNTGDYYDLFENRETFTGYDGRTIWTFIHEKICFPEENFNSKLGTDEGALWQRDFNRFVSGLHTSINAHIVQGIQEAPESRPPKMNDSVDYVNSPVLDPEEEYDRRMVKSYPQAIEHLYFGYMLLLCAVREAGSSGRLDTQQFDFGEDTEGSAEGVRSLVNELLASPLFSDPGIQVAERNLRKHAVEADGVKLWQARLRTRDLLNSMDCVQCNICRLHGKVGALGLATALSVLLGAEGRGGDSTRLHRVEVAALISTLGKFASAVQIVQDFELRKFERGDEDAGDLRGYDGTTQRGQTLTPP